MRDAINANDNARAAGLRGGSRSPCPAVGVMIAHQKERHPDRSREERCDAPSFRIASPTQQKKRKQRAGDGNGEPQTGLGPETEQERRDCKGDEQRSCEHVERPEESEMHHNVACKPGWTIDWSTDDGICHRGAFSGPTRDLIQLVEMGLFFTVAEKRCHDGVLHQRQYHLRFQLAFDVQIDFRLWQSVDEVGGQILVLCRHGELRSGRSPTVELTPTLEKPIPSA